MILNPRIRIKPLAGLCRRLSTVLGAGIDLRTAWQRESERATGRAARDHFAAIRKDVTQGKSLADALAARGDYFPALFREMVDVGEQTGHLSEVFAQLADHYEGQDRMRRTFLAAITWPMVQLAMAVVIVGLLICVMGIIGDDTGITPDPLGIGLAGTQGLLIYVAFLAVIATAFAIVFQAIRRGLLWTRFIQRAALQVPMLGPALQTLALARLAWALNLTTQTGMEVRRALRLSLNATRNARYTDRIDAIEAQISQGHSIVDAFSKAGCFPIEFLDTLAVGEESGKVAESMAALAKQYHQRAQTALGVLTTLAGFAVWGFVAMILIVLIFRGFLSYIGMIEDAAGM